MLIYIMLLEFTSTFMTDVAGNTLIMPLLQVFFKLCFACKIALGSAVGACVVSQGVSQMLLQSIGISQILVASFAVCMIRRSLLMLLQCSF